jgi:hypothetical protein
MLFCETNQIRDLGYNYSFRGKNIPFEEIN